MHQFTGHGGGVLWVAFFADGKSLASASQDKTVRLWDIASGSEVRRLLGHQDWVKALAVLADGKHLVSSSWDGTVRVWELATGKEINRWGKGHGRFNAVALSSDGSKVAAASQNRGICFWESATGKELAPFAVQNHRALALACSRDGKTCASTSKDGAIRIWDHLTGRQYCPIEEQYHRAMCLAFSPNGKSLATASSSGGVLIWDVDSRSYGPRTKVDDLTSLQLQRMWQDLAGDDAAHAQHSMWTLTRVSRQSVPFIKEHLPPVGVDARRTERLIQDLNDSQFLVRQRATAELEKLGKFAEVAMDKALTNKPPLETRQRLQRLLDKLDRGRLVPFADALRAGRAMQVLEQIDSAESGQLLQALADGAPESWLTQEAKNVLARLAPHNGIRAGD